MAWRAHFLHGAQLARAGTLMQIVGFITALNGYAYERVRVSRTDTPRWLRSARIRTMDPPPPLRSLPLSSTFSSARVTYDFWISRHCRGRADRFSRLWQNHGVAIEGAEDDEYRLINIPGQVWRKWRDNAR